MTEQEKIKKAALAWIRDWNSRQLEKVMSHYADDVRFYSPTVVSRWKKSNGRLKGKSDVKKHFKKGLKEMPHMHFEFHSILYGVKSIVLMYKRETGRLMADFVRFNKSGKVKEVRVCYELKP